MPEVPAHEALTRRDQFQVKKQDKDNKKKTKEEANKTKTKKGSSKKNKVKETKHNKKGKGANKARGRSSQKNQSQGSSKTRSTTVSRGKRATLTGVSSRSVKTQRVAKAWKQGNDKESTHAQPEATVESRKRLRQKTPDHEFSAGTAVKAVHTQDAKAPVKAKAKAKSSPKAKAAACTRKQPKAKEEYVPYDDVQARVEEILLQCQYKGKCCEDHSPDVLALAQNDQNSVFQKSIYWTRPAVGLKVPPDQLSPEKRGNGKKPKQICYFGGGPCAYVNMALMNEYVPSWDDIWCVYIWSDFKKNVHAFQVSQLPLCPTLPLAVSCILGRQVEGSWTGSICEHPALRHLHEKHQEVLGCLSQGCHGRVKHVRLVTWSDHAFLKGKRLLLLIILGQCVK